MYGTVIISLNKTPTKSTTLLLKFNRKINRISCSHHNGGRVGQIARNSGEVEGCDGGDESLQGTEPEPVERLLRPHADRLVAHQALRVVTVEAKEVDQLGGRIDLGLNKKNIEI
jgi:hypothetical protein